MSKIKGSTRGSTRKKTEEIPTYSLPKKPLNASSMYDTDDAEFQKTIRAGRRGEKASRKQQRIANKVRKKNAKTNQNKADNKVRRAIGEKERRDPNLKKPSIYLRMMEPTMYAKLREIGDTDEKIAWFQKKRVRLFLIFILFGVALGFFIHAWLYLSGVVIGLFFYHGKKRQVDSFYRNWKFARQMNFSKFMRLLIPYLKASGGRSSLYTIFNKILLRVPEEDKDERRNLYMLLSDMSNKPTSLKPFTDFAERSSGTDMSHLFMNTVYDFQQTTYDVTVIDELGRMAAEEMMSSIDEIIAVKIRRFNMFPTKIVMSSMILIFGLAAGLVVREISNMTILDEIGETEDSQKPPTAEEKAADPKLSKNQQPASTENHPSIGSSDSVRDYVGKDSYDEAEKTAEERAKNAPKTPYQIESDEALKRTSVTTE